LKILTSTRTWRQWSGDALLLFVGAQEGRDPGPETPARLVELLTNLRKSREWKAESGEILVLHHPPGLEVGRLILIGLGTGEGMDAGGIRLAVMRSIRRLKAGRLGVLAVSLEGCPAPTVAGPMTVEGVVMGTFDSAPYQTIDKALPRVDELLFLDCGERNNGEFAATLERGRVLAESVNLARQLTNEPGNRLGPEQFADLASELADRHGLETRVLGPEEMRTLGLEALLAVASGSRRVPRLLALTHWGDRGDPHIGGCLVGKGVTFDSGGISLKPPQSMEEMKTDKAGACAVLGAMIALARLNAPRNTVGVMPLVENLPGGEAQRPGDVVRTLSGKTVEIINTDAEGRLILADAITYAKRTFEPRWLVDIATLTGACVVALGHFRAGLFSNHEGLAAEFLRASDHAGERFWRMPLDRDYRDELKSQIADLKNVGSRWGGAITAAKFVEEFVEGTPWCHVDMAGMDLFDPEKEGGGPRGFGVRTLVEMVLASPTDRALRETTG
jgi:leucyl aminopeptidase